MTGPRLLVTSGDARTLKAVAGDLTREGYNVATAARLPQAAGVAASFQPDLVVLDYPLTRAGTDRSCQQVRADREVPLLILTTRDCEVDRVPGFRLGIDDYQAKPFSAAELAVRVKAVLARRSLLESLAKNLIQDCITFPDLRIDPRGRVVHLDKRKVELTNKEFDLLWALASKPNQVLSRWQLLSRVWDSAFPGDESTVTVHIHRLREKLEADPANPVYIKTARGRGYKFETAL